MDNFASENITYQLVAPCKHCKQAERAIQTFKAHMKSCLSGANPSFALTEWDRLIPELSITLNLLRNSHCNPKLSACSCIFGQFNFLATPLAPPATKIIAHIHPTKRGSWDLNDDVG